MRQVVPNDIFGGDFDLDTISWIIPRLAVTDMYGALSASRDDDIYIVNTAHEVTTPYDFKLAVEPHQGPDAVRDALGVLADVIHEQMETTETKVLVHCFAGMERSVLACAWYLSKYRSMSMEDAYQAICDVRPIVLDRRLWVAYQSPERNSQLRPAQREPNSKHRHGQNEREIVASAMP